MFKHKTVLMKYNTKIIMIIKKLKNSQSVSHVFQKHSIHSFSLCQNKTAPAKIFLFYHW